LNIDDDPAASQQMAIREGTDGLSLRPVLPVLRKRMHAWVWPSATRMTICDIGRLN
jgi:hypothetical protein